jgi:hypothetical protein
VNLLITKMSFQLSNLFLTQRIKSKINTKLSLCIITTKIIHPVSTRNLYGFILHSGK